MIPSIIIPTLGRTQLLKNLIPNIYNTVAVPFSSIPFEIVVVTEDRETVDFIGDGLGWGRVNLVEAGGTPVEKWNIGAAHASGDWFVLIGDDCLFKPGWLDAVEGTSNGGFVGLYEGVDWVDAVGHFCISRELCCDLFGGALALPPYQSGYFDQEMCLRLHEAGLYTATRRIVLEHNHVSLGKALADDTYRRGQAMQQQDAHVFYQRKTQGFPVDWAPVIRRYLEHT